MSPKDFYVGQVLHYIGFRNRGGDGQIEKVMVTKVGRKWVEASPNGKPGSYLTRRFAPPCLDADGGEYSPPGKFILNVEEYLAGKQADAEWLHLMRSLSSIRRPKHMTSGRIAELREMLKEPTP